MTISSLMTRTTWHITCPDSDWVTDHRIGDSYTNGPIPEEELHYGKKDREVNLRYSHLWWMLLPQKMNWYPLIKTLGSSLQVPVVSFKLFIYFNWSLKIKLLKFWWIFFLNNINISISMKLSVILFRLRIIAIVINPIFIFLWKSTR